MTKKELYEKNQAKARFFSRSAPVFFWGLLILSVIFFILALKNSIGNINEITSLLNSENYTGAELQYNYAYLVEKYGEWVVGNGNGGFQIMFIDVKYAIFNGISIATGILFIVCFVGAWVIGKLFPKIADKIKQDNQDMVNITILEKE